LRIVPVAVLTAVMVSFGACSKDGRTVGSIDGTDGTGTDNTFGTDNIPSGSDDGTLIGDIDNPNGDSDDSVPSTANECSGAQDAGALTVKENAIWRDGATAAYSMIFDDMCDFGIRGLPVYGIGELNSHGLKGTPGPFIEACDENDQWGVVEKVVNEGHEIANHSYTHSSIDDDATVWAKEITEAKSIFDTHLTDTWMGSMSFYVYPFDFFPANSVDAVMDAGHIGSRAGNRDDNDGFNNPPINANTPTNDANIEFDVWPRTYSKYARYASPGFLWVHVWNAIERDGWAVREFHSIVADDADMTTNGFGPVPVTEFDAHLDDLVDAWRKNKVWTSTPSRIIRYRHSRTSCTASISGNTMSYDCGSLADNLKGEVSVIITTANDVPGLDAKQDGKPVSVRKLAANTFAVTGNVKDGDVTIEGCADAAVGVDTGDIKAKPEPAASVCDLLQVTGTGEDGAMDDLEGRTPDLLYELPNPEQADGRDGSWSGYPGETTIEMSTTEGNPGNSLHFVAEPSSYGDGGEYVGVTLAFLGGNGAGSCYDGSVYTGIQFDIKGKATIDPSVDWWPADNVTVSIVTAETQTQALGGDAPCQFGHYSAFAPISADWTTVTIKFSEFVESNYTGSECKDLDPPILDKPSKPLALTKLQAIDWGFPDASSGIDIYIDNVKMVK
jgi:hypothetical protein